ncbi:MAG TPA: TonB-dependent receptor [Candidatus Udaeobacter sp.]
MVGQEIPLTATKLVEPTPGLQLDGSDTAALLEDVPGAAVVRNGPLTGIVQLRGLSDDHVGVLVNGMQITPACPNHMDPPLLYIAPSQLHSLTVLPGITSVSLGGDNIGGMVLAEPKPPAFATTPSPLFTGEVGSFYRSSNDGVGVNGGFTLANPIWSGSYEGSWQTADDLRFPGGRVRDSGIGEYQQHEGQIATQILNGVLNVYGGVSRTRDAGTPAQPMDMIKDDGWNVGGRMTGNYSFGQLDARIGYITADHTMDNFSLRPLASTDDPFTAPSQSDDLSGSIGLTIPHDSDTFRTGFDFHWSRFDAFEKDLSDGSSQEDINNANRSRVGVYLEWQTDWSPQWTTLIGLRNDTVWSDAGNVEQFYSDSAADAAAFNSHSHEATNVNLDAMASVRFTPDDHQSYELAFARKTRSPSILERYIYTPFAALSGNSDGRNYLGNLDLVPEVSHEIALTGSWHTDGWGLRVTPFYNFVTDYIQGTPIDRFVNDLAVLQYQNLDRADLYGVDAESHYDLSKVFTLRGQASYVRGINRDNGDNLYRIEPLHGRVSLEEHWSGWRGAVELAWAAPQHKVSAFNDELPSPGYALLNLRAGYTFREHLNIDVALENVFDTRYEEHLTGINYVLKSDVPVGARIPGPGRFVAVSVGYKF